MHRILDSIGLPLADILGLLNDVRWPEWAGDSEESHTVHRKVLTSGTKRKHPNKHAGKTVNRKIHKGRHLVQVHDAFRDPGHTPALCVVSYIDTRCFLAFGYPVCVPVCVSIIMSACLFTISKIGVIMCAVEFSLFKLWYLGCNKNGGMPFFFPVFCRGLDGWLIDHWLHKHVNAWLSSCSMIKSGYPPPSNS